MSIDLFSNMKMFSSKKLRVILLVAFAFLFLPISTIHAATLNTAGYTATGNSSYDLKDIARQAGLSLDSNEEYLESSVISPDGQYVYFGSYFSPGSIIKVDTSNLTRISSVVFNSGEDYPNAAIISPDGLYGYFGLDTSPVTIVKVNLSTMTRDSALTLDSGENQIFSKALISPDGLYGYFSANTSPGIIVKVNLSTMTRDSALTLDVNENSIGSAIISPDGLYGYFGTRTNPATIVKVNLSTMTRDSALTLDSGENKLYSYSAAISSDGLYGYFGTDTSPGKIVKVNLSTMTRDSALTLDSVEGSIYSVLISPEDNYLYLGLYNSFPGMVVKVNPNTMTRISSIILDSDLGEYTLYSGIISPDGAYAYFGTDNSPGRIIKVSLASQLGYTKATKVSLSEYAESVESLSFNTLTASSNARLALYDTAQTLIWESNSFAVTTGTNTVLISSGTPTTLTALSAGDYYLAFQVDGTGAIPSIIQNSTNGGVSGDGLYLTQAYGAFPANMSSFTSSSERFSLAMNYYGTPVVVSTPVSYGHPIPPSFTQPQTITTPTITTPTINVTTKPQPTLTKTLRPYAKGVEVKSLQSILNTFLTKKLAVDGIFGKQTISAIKSFQKSKGLVVDGIVGKKTIKELEKIAK